MKVLKFTVFTPFQNLSDCEDSVCFCGNRLDAVFKLPYYLSTPKITKYLKFDTSDPEKLENLMIFVKFVIFDVPR